jgi:glycosyltransferase involved in cell wall biosynthesis
VTPPGARPRVLVVHPGAELYGADRALAESAAALAGRFDVTVVLPGTGPLVAELEGRGLRVVQCRMPVLRNAALRPRGAWRLLADAVRGTVPALRLLRNAGEAGVYVNTLTLPSWPLLARLAGRRSVCHVHEAEQSAPRLLRIGMVICPALADRVIANSRFCLDVLAETAPWLRRRATVVYNAVPGPASTTPARTELDGPVRLLFVGRLSPRKGPQVAVATLQELLARGVDARLQLLGSVFEGYEWFEAELRAAVADAGLTDRVEFLGFRSPVWPSLAASDVVLVPSVMEESFGLTAVEAVLAGRPLVVSDGSGLREAAAGYGSAQAVVPGDALLWADAVQRVIDDWKTFRQAAADDAAEARRRHAPARYAEQLTAVLDALTDAPGPPRPGSTERPLALTGRPR